MSSAPLFHEQFFDPRQMEALRRAQGQLPPAPGMAPTLGTRFGAGGAGGGPSFDFFLNRGGNPDAAPQTGFQFEFLRNGAPIGTSEFSNFLTAPVLHTQNRPNVGFQFQPGVDPSQFAVRGFGHGLDQLFQLGPQGATQQALRPGVQPGGKGNLGKPQFGGKGGGAPFQPDAPAPPDEENPFGPNPPFWPNPFGGFNPWEFPAPQPNETERGNLEGILRQFFPWFFPDISGGPGGTPPTFGGENPAAPGGGGIPGFPNFGPAPPGTFGPLPSRPGEPQIDEAGRVALKGDNLDALHFLGQLLQSLPDRAGQSHALNSALMSSAFGMVPDPRLFQAGASSFFGPNAFSNFLGGQDPLAQQVQGLANSNLAGGSVAQGRGLVGGSVIPGLEHILNQGLPGQREISGGIFPGEEALRQLFDPSLPGSTRPGEAPGPVQWLNAQFAHGFPGQQTDTSGREGFEGLQGFLTNLGRDATGEAQSRLQNLGAPGIQNTIENSLTGLIQGGGLSPEFVRASQERILEPSQDQLVERLNSLGGGFANLGTSGVAGEALQELSSDFNNDMVRAGFQNLGQATGQGLQLGGQQFGQGFNTAQALGNLGQFGASQVPNFLGTLAQSSQLPIRSFTDLTNSLTSQGLGRFGAVPQNLAPFFQQAGGLGMDLQRFGLQSIPALLSPGFQAQQFQDQRIQQGISSLLQGLGASQGILGQNQNFVLNALSQGLDPLLAFMSGHFQRDIAGAQQPNFDAGLLGLVLGGGG